MIHLKSIEVVFPEAKTTTSLYFNDLDNHFYLIRITPVKRFNETVYVSILDKIDEPDLDQLLNQLQYSTTQKRKSQKNDPTMKSKVSEFMNDLITILGDRGNVMTKEESEELKKRLKQSKE